MHKSFEKLILERVLRVCNTDSVSGRDRPSDLLKIGGFCESLLILKSLLPTMEPIWDLS